MNESYVLRLEFITNLNEKVFYNIPYAKSTLTGPEIKTLMDAVKSTGIVSTNKGKLSISNGAELIATTTSDVDW